MKFDEITWNIIPNTVADRMIDSSLTHKLVPSRKLPRRNKATNVMIKQFQNLKSYRQYVEIKTLILRCLTNNSETEDNVSFSEDDNSLANYTQLISEERKNYFYKTKNKNDNVSPRRRSTQKFKRKSSITLGWQKVVKSENISLTRKSNTNNFIYDNDNINKTSSATNNVKKNTQNKMNTFTKINCIKQNISNLENQLPIENETNVATVVQKSDENHYYKTLNSPNINTLKDLPALLDNLNENRNINDENMSFEQNCSDHMKQDSNITETIMNETLIINNTYQPKDSGIDEDTEEECLENGKTDKISNNKTKDKEQDTSSTISVLNNLRNSNNDPKSETYNMSDKKEHFQDTIENINAKEKMQTKKPQSIVTHTEIVNKKYKVVSSMSVFTEDMKPEELSINNSCDEKVEIEEIQQIEDDIFHSTERQLSQFGRLNLTVDSDSSTVDSDSTFENMIDKLYKRSARDSSPDTKQLSFATNKSAQDKSDLNYATSCVFDKKKNIKESNEKNLEIGSMMQPVDKKSICGRPYNLQEFVKRRNLMPKTTEPSFTLKDIDEEEEQAFITLPRSILENKLVGNKIVLTENTLKLGKEKYKIKHKNKDNMSSIFGRKNSKILYKIVNIKPIANVVTQGKITKADEIKDNVIPKKRHLQLEQNFKKKIKKKHLNIDE
ncbi:hypothetical protein WN51_11347 [Melipona quadrifasciata]|uniref:Uncharacterized protein n=1 Tax=Melipona quadrifasciata TaxID=166423 RepID=A0A0M9A946_9HYME|nr:hypothetical protein WN51_11347 [Melipona quadrifasciata]